jgi:hypothetical protein
MSFAVSDFAAVHWAALCAAPVSVNVAGSSRKGGIWGVSDPLCHPPIIAPRFSLWGSLTPQMRVAIVRRDRAMSVTPSSAPPVSPLVHAPFTFTITRLTGFARNSRSYR